MKRTEDVKAEAVEKLLKRKEEELERLMQRSGELEDKLKMKTEVDYRANQHAIGYFSKKIDQRIGSSSSLLRGDIPGIIYRRKFNDGYMGAGRRAPISNRPITPGGLRATNAKS